MPESQPLYRIVDLGCGETPFPLDEQGRLITDNQEYIGYDLFPGGDPDHTNQLLQATWRSRGQGSGYVARADITNLPLEDGSADEVLFTNILSDPRVNQPAVLREAVRVLRRPDGLLTVVDTYAPFYFTVSQVQRALGALGLSQTNMGSEHMPEAIRPYALTTRKGSAYICTFSHPGSKYLQKIQTYPSIQGIKQGGPTTMPDSAQERYHAAAMRVNEELDTHVASTKVVGGHYEQEQGKAHSAGVAYRGLVEAVRALAAYHTEQTMPSHGQATEKLGTATGTFRREFPIPEERPYLADANARFNQINAAQDGTDEEQPSLRTTGVRIGENYQRVLEQLGALAPIFGVDDETRGQLEQEVAGLPADYEQLAAQDAQVQQVLLTQKAIS